MSTRPYGQYCGLARAMELVGERWAMLIVRDLLVGSRRFSDLRRGLPGIPTNILTARLKELEAAGLVRRRVLARPASGMAYELTPYGAELEEAVKLLGRWGAASLAEPRPDDTITVDSLVMALRSTFRPEAARDVRTTFELRAGPIVVHTRITDGTLEAAAGGLPNADLVIEAGPGVKALMAHEVMPEDAIARGIVRVHGDASLLALFVQLFRIDPLPEPGIGRRRKAVNSIRSCYNLPR